MEQDSISVGGTQSSFSCLIKPLAAGEGEGVSRASWLVLYNWSFLAGPFPGIWDGLGWG